MTRKVGIIGLGNVGAAVAHHFVSTGSIDELVLIDTRQEKVAADALDFEDAMANLPFHTTITINDYAALENADLIISALGNIALQDNQNDDRFAELPYSKKEVEQVAKQIKASGFAGILIVITNPVDAITELYQKRTGLPQERVIGTGTLLDSARMKRAVAKALALDPRSVIGFNLGEHGNSQFTAWSTVRIGGQTLIDYLAEQGRQLDLDALDHEAKVGGHTVFHGKKYTNYGVATAAVMLAMTVLNDAHTILPVSHYMKNYDTYLSYPAVVGKNGIVASLSLDLTNEELEKLAQSAAFIRQHTSKF
ncbi:MULTISPECIES: L-lactate dehydrogenase [Enterococcus]|uniref:L-2-hydroxyisocaproate dehydrogenase n=1 Tax=Enterococcus sulfureus ATCC 49903 TaxID=1140003 RepID=S0P0P1_9ENTE|nr:L-lactate dehydrogenase [Enterococcus sulfureus]EOT49480.1 hypothetical protein OMY_00408 [Enterococcus sulfureus ATCC 49903]EOT87347.1 hypothetical protein I573_00403 [Enterococcus sulfureus ATCC 49903]